MKCQHDMRFSLILGVCPRTQHDECTSVRIPVDVRRQITYFRGKVVNVNHIPGELMLEFCHSASTCACMIHRQGFASLTADVSIGTARMEEAAGG